jgi:sterol 3beta-glucosyltransferase
MKVCIVASGSRGDVQPTVALAAALAARGHETRLVAPKNFGALAEGRGFAFHPMPIDVAAMASDPVHDILVSGRGSPLAFIRWSREWWRAMVYPIACAILEGGESAECVVATGIADTLGGMLAERLGAPCIHAWWAPMFPARDFLFDTAETPLPHLPGWVNRAAVLAFEQAVWIAMRGSYRASHALYGLSPPGWTPPLRKAVARGEPLLLAYSGALLPRSREWPANVEPTGWWFLDAGANWTPPAALERFLADGPPPVYVGFGSMLFADRAVTVAATLGALERVGARAIISAGWGGLTREDLPSTVFALEEAPHDWLFPRMAAIVHHGGAGTTGATLRAGKPSVVTPFIVDQFAWGRLLAGHGLAPAPLPHRTLTTEALAAALTQALSDVDMRAKAAKTGERVRAEDGLAHAVAVIERAGAVAATKRSGRLRTGTR